MMLSDALVKPNDRIIAFVGGGGKTTLMYRLAQEQAASGERVVVTTTTHIMKPTAQQAQSLILSEDLAVILEELSHRLASQHVIAVGTRVINAEGKMKGIPPEWVEEVAKVPAVQRVILEADGSMGRPFKAPADYEPVIPASTDLVVPVIGIDALGKPFGPEIVHRPERVAAIATVEPGDAITADLVARVAMHPLGLAKGTPQRARLVPVINKVDDSELLEIARQLGRSMLEAGADRVVIARAQHEPPVWEVLQR